MAGLVGHISQEDREWLERNEGRCGPLGYKTVDDDYEGMYNHDEETETFECTACDIEFYLVEEKIKGKRISCPVCKKILKNKG